jgi:hypothetical protein
MVAHARELGTGRASLEGRFSLIPSTA